MTECNYNWRLTQPSQLGAEFGLLSVDTEPDSTSGVPGIDVLTLRDFCKV